MHHKNKWQMYARAKRLLERALKLMKDKQEEGASPSYLLGLADMAEIILDELGPIMEDPHAQDDVVSFPTWRRGE